MLFVKTPQFLKKIIPSVTWDIPTTEKVVYLTFDDGPTPEITEWVLDQLALFNAKATFFCIGKNIDANPKIFRKILSEGHSVGNHTYNHMNAWKTNKRIYLENSFKTENSILKLHPHFKSKKLFRPPYGKFTPSILKRLRKENYQVVGWDIITEDYDKNRTPSKVLLNVTKNITPGSIIVFHDSVKAFKNLEEVLPKTLTFLEKEGYVMKSI
ncbi:Peptidoglycan/xylan/chitin deacetylase, PgdA/CDA1 family [Pustulibacterium marinum]|uniref:Peptidoglycan/xylan/chitin deacetylase, PgdA/CDA1 family n=1 Tax=Pustulibacterium marinum TaxID=1224947 RepID=A0A1I7HAT2_9FLAO|nr:polysaccharide deacetylase family protein [Pustulibacterium marinum]SFU57797.1 Peptidoglycan/xylan/chitin deacetylase, PgdA/CDA1 family [Pustulibacterium marinum]